MAAIKKTATQPASAPAPSPAPAKAPATKAAPVAKSAEPVAVVPPVETTVVPPVAEGGAATPVVEDSFQAVYDELVNELTTMSTRMKTLLTKVKVMQREYNKAIKTGKRGAKKAPGVKRTPSGFAKPTKLSDELCKFLNLELGSEKARTEVTKQINEYVKQNNLQDPNDKRRIFPNDALKKIMNLKEGDQLSYFNMQKFIKHHFVKA